MSRFLRGTGGALSAPEPLTTVTPPPRRSPLAEPYGEVHTWRAMSQENVALVRELLEAFRRRDHERAFDFYDPAIVWEVHDDSDLGGVYPGHEGVRTYWRAWLSAWRDLQFEVQDLRDAGDEVVALIHKQRQWGRHSGIELEMPPYGIVFTIHNGKVARWRFYPAQESALEAAGLRE
jgi:ketosteroid isomerase-like protein